MRGKGWLYGMGLLFSGQAMAVCSVVSTTPAAFGSISSMTVRTAAQTSSTVNAGLSCTSALISLLVSTDHFYATITSAHSGMVGPTGDVIGYTVYGDSSRSVPIARGAQFDFGGAAGIAQSIGLIAGPGVKTVPLYLSSITGSNVAAGVYTETLNIAWNWSYCSGIGLGGVCLGRDTGNATASLTVSMTVTNDCQITAPAISFGSAPVISGFTTVTGQTSISCTKGSAYSVGLSDGQNALSVGGRRRMISGSNYLAYDIFKSAGTTRWGSVGAARRDSSTAEINPGNGLGVGVGSQVFNYNARVYTDQTTPPAGAYIDNVVLDIGF